MLQADDVIGTAFSDSEKDRLMCEVVSKIIDDFGVEIFADSRKANAVVADYITDSSLYQEAALLKRVIASGAVSFVATTSIDNYVAEFQRALYTLTEREFIAESFAKKALGWFVVTIEAHYNAIVQKWKVAVQKLAMLSQQCSTEKEDLRISNVITRSTKYLQTRASKDNLEAHRKELDDVFDEINAIEREMQSDQINEQPQMMDCIVTSTQTYKRNMTVGFALATGGQYPGTVKACLSYEGKQYVVIDIPALGLNNNIVICTVCDTSLDAVNDTKLCAILCLHCIANGLLNND